MEVLTLKDLQAAVNEAMQQEGITGDEPIVIDGGGPVMPVEEIQSAGLLVDGRRRMQAQIIRDGTTDCDCGVFVFVMPRMIPASFWSHVVEDLEKKHSATKSDA